MESQTSQANAERPRIICVGGAVLDRKYRARKELIQGTSNPVDGMTSHGGVARNVTENLARLGARVSFVSALGDDEAGRILRKGLTALSVDISGVMVFPDRSTAEYVAVLDPRNELALGLADMAVFDRLAPPMLAMAWRDLQPARWVFTDCNPPAETLAWLVARGRLGEFHLAVDTVSSPKSAKLPADLTGVSVLFTNVDEAAAMLGRPAVSPAQAAQALQARGAANVVVTDGGRGYAVAAGNDVTSFPVVAASPVDITGAGDAMIAGTLFSMLLGSAIGAATRVGALVAALTIESTASVRPDLSPALLEAAKSRMIE